MAMYNPRGNVPPRPRDPKAPGPRGPFQGPGQQGPPRQAAPTGNRMPQRFAGSEVRPGFSRPHIQATQQRMDPRQAGERMNVERQQKEEGRATQWDNPFSPGKTPSSSGTVAEPAPRVQSRYTTESASSILASFGLSNEDLEELSRYPDDQLTPENMPLILRDIRMRKVTSSLPNLASQNREKETFCSDAGRGSMVKSKVIDYGHESKYGYTKSPLDAQVYNPSVPAAESMKGFPTQQTTLVPAAPATVTSTQMNAVEELIRKMGFQRSTPTTQSFFPMNSNKVPGLCLPSAGTGMPPAVQPMAVQPMAVQPMAVQPMAVQPMAVGPPVGPPVGQPMRPPMVSPVGPPVVPTVAQPVMPPVVQQVLPPAPVVQPIIPAVNQPPPSFVPEMLESVNRRDRIHHESRANPPNAPPGPLSGQKTMEKNPESAIESPFGVVKASWLPVFSQAHAQTLKRLPTPSMMNDYFAASPRIFPHVCSLCNVECRHLKDWIQHQNTATHIENGRRLRQQYPDWNPESHSSSKRRDCSRKEEHVSRQHSLSPTSRHLRQSSSGHARRQTRSRSRSPGRLRASRSRSPGRLRSPGRIRASLSRSPGRIRASRSRSPGRPRASRPRSRSPRRLPSPRRRVRSPSRSPPCSSHSERSSSRKRPARATRSPDQALEAAVKCLGPHFVEQFNKQKSLQAASQGISATEKPVPEPAKPSVVVKKIPSNPASKPFKKEAPSQSTPENKPKPEDASAPNKGGVTAEAKVKKVPPGTPAIAPNKGGVTAEAKIKKAPPGAPAIAPNKGGVTAEAKIKKAPPGAPAIAPNKGGVTAEAKIKKAPSGAPAKETKIFQPIPFHRLLTDKCLSAGTVLQISDLPDDGFTDQDIKKLVQPFGKVSDIFVLRSRNEAFLEMNYKEAVIAAVKYGETVPVLVNGKRVKISIAEKPKAPPIQNKGTEKTTENIKKVIPPVKTPCEVDGAERAQKKAVTSPSSPSWLRGEGWNQTVTYQELMGSLLDRTDQAKAGAKLVKSVEAAPATLAVKNKKDGETPKVGESKATVKPKNATDFKKPVGPKAAVKQANPADSKNPEEAKKALEVKKSKTVKKVVKPKAKEADKSTAASDVSEATKRTDNTESIPKEPEEMCVVLVSNLPSSALTQEEITNLTKPFGKVKDFLIVSSHKKVYLEMNRNSADSMVKFYTCFPMCMEKNQLCITLAAQFKDLKDEEAIFISMIKEANPEVDTENLPPQFVQLGNLPDEGYSELEILCVGLRFGRVDHYMVLINKNKAILQLDSAESAASMCRFLKRYPYCLGASQLTVSRSPEIEALLEEEAKKRMAARMELAKESSDLKTIPEGSGGVQPAAVPSAEPTKVNEELGSDLKANCPEAETEHAGTEGIASDASSKPSGAGVSEEDSGVTTPDHLGSSEVKTEEVCALPPDSKEEEKGTENSTTESPEPASDAAGQDKMEELAAPAGSHVENVHSEAESEDTGMSLARTEEEASTAVAAAAETPLPDASEAPVEDLSGETLQSKNKPENPEASVDLAETSAGQAEEAAAKETENPFCTTEETAEAACEAQAVETADSTEQKTEPVVEKQPESLLSSVDATEEEKLETNGNPESSEQTLSEAQSGKGPGQAEAEESGQDGVLEAEQPTPAEASVDKVAPEVLVPVPSVTRKRRAPQRREEQTSPVKPATRSRTAAERNLMSKEANLERSTSSRSDVLEGSTSKLGKSPPVVELGPGKSLPQQDKEPQAETKGSSKQTRERESRPCSAKREAFINKVPGGRNTRSSKSNAKAKEEEELSPFNLDEFVTMDEVVDEADSPSLLRRNPLKGKRKELAKKPLPYAPSPKRKKGKGARLAERELSFVTLDEIGEDEGTLAQAELLSPGALPESQALVMVDEVNEEEELIYEVIKDPQSLVTLDEISEHEESIKDAFALGDDEPDLKTEPLVTVDEIGEVEELPLDAPSHFKVVGALKAREDEKQVLEDPGDFLSSQIPEDPSTLVTVDEIHEDSDDQPLVTPDEVTEDEEELLADFNRMKEELTFVTVDEVGSEDDEEEKNDTFTDADTEESVAKTVTDYPTAGPVSEAEKEVVTFAEHAEAGILDLGAGEDSLEGIKVCEETTADDEKNLAGEATEMEVEGRTLKTAQKIPGADAESVQPLPELALNHTELSDNKESNRGENQQLSGLTESECEEPESKRTRRDSSETSKASRHLKDLDFLVPKAGFFCQICSCFCVDEASMKTHCQSQLHQENMEKFMGSKGEEGSAGKKEAKEEAEEPGPR